MTQIRDFVLSLISASAATLILHAVMPDGELKKYLKYLFALFVLVILLSPLKEILPGIGDMSDVQAYSHDLSRSTEFANGIVAEHIKTAISGKFSVPERDITVTLDGEKTVIKMQRAIGVLAEDITYYTATVFGVPSEVIFYE